MHLICTVIGLLLLRVPSLNFGWNCRIGHVRTWCSGHVFRVIDHPLVLGPRSVAVWWKVALKMLNTSKYENTLQTCSIKPYNGANQTNQLALESHRIPNGNEVHIPPIGCDCRSNKGSQSTCCRTCPVPPVCPPSGRPC